MKEHPILFSGPMVRAILEGRKTQTRRTIKNPDRYGRENEYGRFQVNLRECPYGQLGDRLWVRETWRYADWTEDGYPFIEYAATPGRMHLCDNIPGECDERLSDIWAGLSRPENYDIDGRAADRNWRPSIHLPRWTSRLLPEVTSVRVERVQDISEEDAKAEGCFKGQFEYQGFPYDGEGTMSSKESFQCLWDSINAKSGNGWDTNPLVWVVEFKRVQP